MAGRTNERTWCAESPFSAVMADILDSSWVLSQPETQVERSKDRGVGEKIGASVLQKDAAEASKSEGTECTGSYDGMLLGEPSPRCAVKSPNLLFWAGLLHILMGHVLETAALTCCFRRGTSCSSVH